MEINSSQAVAANADSAPGWPAGTTVSVLAEGFQFLEGPVWFPAAGGLVFSDIPADRMWLWTPGAGCRIFREPSNHANGNTVDRQGRLLTCEHGGRRIVRREADGSLTVLADRYRGRRLNSPNDIAVDALGRIWFSDPPYGIRPEEQEQPACYLFRLDPDGGLEAVADDFIKPNGLCFSPDGTVLYVSDTANERHHIRRFQVGPEGRLAGGEVLLTIAPGKSDGFRVDRFGRIWSSAGDGVWVVSPGGAVLARIPVPEAPANLCFGGGPAADRLFITARTRLYALAVEPGVGL
ncbi:MAG: SMP-30/gluconolactonase/LRE family protein [Lentisphaeria bacterium]